MDRNIIQTLKKRQSYYTLLIGLMLVSGGLFSCVSDEISQGQVQPPLSERYMKLRINLPAYQIPDAADVKKDTKAMDDNAESAINADLLNILIFKEDGMFYYKAPVVDGSVQVDASDPSKGTVTIKMVKSGANEKFNLMVVANHNLIGITLIEGVTTKDSVLQSQVYSVDKWNAATGNSDPFPMWGEVAGLEVKEQNTEIPEITLYRALARIDVGLGFKVVDDNMTEEVEGLAGFKINQVNVYRTYDKGYVTPGVSTPKPDETGYAPSIPGDAVRRADNSPLAFTFAETDRYIREIYVPEANLPDSPSNGNMHCIVVGGIYNGSQSYYRLDFAEDQNENTRGYLPILRNHRYIFNILDVKGPGFSDPEKALQSTPSGTIEYEVIVWDETIHEMHVQGKYYFGLDNREITLKAIRTEEQADNKSEIKYQTNYPVSSADGISFEWENPTDSAIPSVSPYFEATWIEEGGKGTIRITALTNNESNTVLTDVLHVRLGTFVIKVIVNQEYKNFKYTLNCTTVRVFGTYRPGYKLNTTASNPPTHRIELSFTAENTSIIGSRYEIYTEEKYGIAFRGSGTFTSLTQNVILTGEGTLNTPDSAKTDPFTVKIVSNSSSGSYCEATISPVLSKMKIVTLATKLYGVEPGNKANKILTNTNNFGPNDNSVVKIDGFEIFHPGNTLNAATEALLTKSGGELADFVVLGHEAHINERNKHLFANYLKKGGVIVAFLENPTSYAGPLLTAIFPGCQVSWSSPAYGAGTVYPFPGNKAYEAIYTNPGNKPWDVYYSDLQKDPILFGPFGDIRDKQWGEDASSTTWVKGIPADYLTVYTTSGNLYNGVTLHTDKITGFRYQSNEINLVWFGDGGFTSGLGDTGTTAYPFQIDKNANYPIPANGTGNGYGYGVTKYPVYNSHVFSNAMVWAIKRSAELLPKRDAASAN